MATTQPMKWLWPLLAILLLTGCASTPPPGEPHDPLEGFNRNVYAFNETVDTYALAPASRGWTRVTTDGMRQGVHNFFDNLQAPGYILNDLLQGKPAGAGIQTTRFVVNSTVGLLGFLIRRGRGWDWSHAARTLVRPWGYGEWMRART